MHRFYLPHCAPPQPVLTGGEAHHALRVLRLRPGDRLQILDGQGRHFDCEIESTGRDQVLLRVIEIRTAPAPVCRTTLLQAIPKGKLIESIIQKSVELGVSRVVPLITERVVKRFDAADLEDVQDKWRQVAVEAIKQSGSPWLPAVEAPCLLKDALTFGNAADLALVGSLRPQRAHPRTWFQAFRQSASRLPATVALWIGPEGDFTDSELDLLLASGAKPVTMGELILRTETAALYGLSMINYEISAPTA